MEVSTLKSQLCFETRHECEKTRLRTESCKYLLQDTDAVVINADDSLTLT